MAAVRKEAVMHVEPYATPEALADLRRHEPRAQFVRWLMAVRLALLGWAAAAIAGEVLLSGRQVYAWVARYKTGGAAALAERPGRGREGPPAADEERLKGRLRAGPTEADSVRALRSRGVRRILRADFGVVRSRRPTTGCTAWASSRCGPARGTPRPRARAGGPQESLPGRVADAAAAHPGERVDVWLEDEVRFGKKGTRTTVWAPRGSRPTAVRRTQYDYLWVIAAACPTTSWPRTAGYGEMP
jgi:transposase